MRLVQKTATTVTFCTILKIAFYVATIVKQRIHIANFLSSNLRISIIYLEPSSPKRYSFEKDFVYSSLHYIISSALQYNTINSGGPY